MLSLFAVVALLGWIELPRGRIRSVWAIAAVPAAITVIALSAPVRIDRLDNVTDRAERIGEVQGALKQVLEEPRQRALLRRCQPVWIRELLDRPLVAYRLEVAPERVLAEPPPATASAIVPASLRAPFADLTSRGGNRMWTVYASC